MKKGFIVELISIWVFIILVFCLDLLLVLWMFKHKKKMRRFSLVPIFLIFVIPFLEQPKIPDNILLDIIGIILLFFGLFTMTMGGYEFYKKGIIPALSKKETNKIESDELIHQLVTTGIYGIFRHPQYVGLFTFFIGYSLFLGGFFTLCITPLILVWFGVVAYIEERYDLELIFGDKYRRYKKRVGMFFPKFSN